MSVVLPPSPSGFPPVDQQWGGFLPGNAYLLVGRASEGRSELALQSVRASVAAEQRCLLISPRDKDTLVAAAQPLGLNLAEAHATGRFRLLRIPPAAQLAARGADGIEQAYADFQRLIRTDRPDRVVVEDFTPLVQFDTFDRLRAAFQGLLDEMVRCKASLLIGLGQPGNDASRRLVELVGSLTAGVMTLGVDADGRRTLSLSRTGTPDPAPAPAAAPSVPAAPDPPPAAPEPAPPAEIAAAPPVADAQPEAIPAPPPEAAPEPDPDLTDELGALDDYGFPEPARDAMGTPITEIIPPPEPDPDLLRPGLDTLVTDPADEIIEQGYLVDSHAGRVAGRIAAASTAEVPAFAPLGAPLAFAPLGGDPNATFVQALTESFGSLAYGTPFLVVALRMEPTSPEAAHFNAVADALRGALPPTGHLLVDDARKRAAVLIPAAGAEAVQPLYASLQASLAQSLGSAAAGVLQAVGAVTIPNGQPFLSAQDLLAYAIEG
jgi:hypothetical protein